MSERRFGVEIECGIEDYWHEEEYAKGVDRAVEDQLHELFGRRWGDVGYDGTLIEVRTPILQGEEGFRELRKVMEHLASIGAYTTEEDGLHVHHDAPEFVDNGVAVVRLVKSWYHNQDLIDHFCAEYRADWGYCPKTWNELTIAELAHHFNTDTFGDWWDERGALNVEALRHHGTIEIRQHEGTLDPDKAEAWVRFGQAFIDSVAQRSRAMTCSASLDSLLKRVKVPEQARKTLLAASW